MHFLALVPRLKVRDKTVLQTREYNDYNESNRNELDEILINKRKDFFIDIKNRRIAMKENIGVVHDYYKHEITQLQNIRSLFPF